MSVVRLVIDTNVLMDALRARPRYGESAKRILVLGRVREFDLWVSAGQMKDLTYFLTEGGKPSLAERAMEQVEGLRKFVNVCSLTAEDIDEMLRLAWVDPEDSLVDIAARRVGADAIVTGNKKDFARSSLMVFTADELFNYLREKKGLDFDLLDW